MPTAVYTRSFSLFAFIMAGLCLSSCNEGEKESSEDSPPRQESGQILAGLDDFEQSWKQSDDPDADGWDSESFNVAAGDQLKQFGEWLVAKSAAPELLSEWFTEEAKVVFPSQAGDSKKLELGGFSISRRTTDQSKVSDALASELAAQFGWLRESEDARFKFKIFELLPIGGGSGIRGKVSVAFSGEEAGKMREQHATWKVEWSGDFGQEEPRLSSVVSLGSESASSLSSGGSQSTLFSDCTQSVLGANDCYESQLQRGLNHWLQRVPFRLPVTLFGTPGLAVGDVNGDGLDDLYLCQESGIPNRLFLQNPDGSATEVSAKWGVDWIDDSRSALLLDLDNDGDQDLVLASFRNVIVASNEGNTRFKVRTVLPASETLMSLCAADYDSDGRLDLYVCAYDPNELLEEKVGQVAVSAGPFVYYDSNNGAANSLFKNQIKGEDWKFVDATKSIGLDVNNRRWSYAASWEDFDNDGDQDLYVANDFGRNNLYRNDEGKFTDIAAQVGAEDSASGMSAAWGDYDRDGLMDLYVGNMWSSAGRRIVPQEKFKPEIGTDMRGVFKRFARGNSLMRNVGGERFEDVSEAAGVTLGRWAWSSPFVDINNNGWEDLVVANGYITGGGSGDL